MSAGRRSAELSLLLLCAASGDALTDGASTLRLAREVEDWSAFVELAGRHALVPTVALQLARLPAGTVPPHVIQELGAKAQQGVLRSLQLSGELVAACRVLQACGVDVLAFKGPTLAALVYGSLSLRQYEDLDILVHPSDVERVRVACFELGYAPVATFNEQQRASVRLSGHHEQLAQASTGVTLELHWSLNNRSLTRDAFEHRWWENRQHVSIGGMDIGTLGVEQLLLYLCMHGGKHSWGRLSWLCDFHRAVARYPNADWKLVWELARTNGARRMVEIGLILLETVFGDDALTTVAAAGRQDDSEARVLAETLARRLRGELETVEGVDFSVQFRSRERWRDRLRYTWHVLATPHHADVSLFGLPRTFHGAYYVVRPFRLLAKHLSRRVRHASTT